MKMTVKEFVKLDLTSLMQVNGGTSACGNYTQTQPATPPSGGNETNNSPSNNGGGTGGSGNNTTSHSPSYSGGSTTGTSTGTCGGSGGQNKNPGGDNPSNDKPNNDTTNNNNNNNGSCGTSVGGCSSINGGNDTTNNNEINDDSETTNQSINIGTGSWGDVDSNSTMQDELKEGMKNATKEQKEDPDYVPDSDFMNGEYVNADGEKESYRFSKVGCKMEGASQIASEITGSDVSITDVNNNYDTNKDGLLTQQEISNGISSNLKEGQSLKIDYYELTLSAETVRTIAASSEGTTYVLGRAEDVAGGQHWVVLEGYSINERGQVEFTYNATSSNDIKNNRVYILGDVDSDQTNTYKISKIETYTVTNSVVGCELQ